MLKLDPSKTPHDIEERSFAIIDAEIPQPRPFTGKLWAIARRMIHTTGDVNIINDIVLCEKAVEAGILALRQGCTVFTDTEMARCGMVSRRLSPLNVTTKCILSGANVEALAKEKGCTRARAGMLEIGHELGGNIVAIGNAPTALLSLLEILHDGIPPPALIIGMPVGFVNAAESKELLIKSSHVHLSLKGRKGGSPLVASVVNALAIFALE